ncbi:hypothetical protein BD310DRAFT_169862 [Dichomitus squalens]|uniref:Uncharacterized protein n=1 Tax=Dichomitus squalens TaxID=114155 RepID=A0A4Q9PHF9_9APHY|nr:hypothetical protein BD310DRAFT_169862 [Dichomitus squalens]
MTCGGRRAIRIALLASQRRAFEGSAPRLARPALGEEGPGRNQRSVIARAVRGLTTREVVGNWGGHIALKLELVLTRVVWRCGWRRVRVVRAIRVRGGVGGATILGVASAVHDWPCVCAYSITLLLSSTAARCVLSESVVESKRRMALYRQVFIVRRAMREGERQLGAAVDGEVEGTGAREGVMWAGDGMKGVHEERGRCVLSIQPSLSSQDEQAYRVGSRLVQDTAVFGAHEHPRYARSTGRTHVVPS